MLRKLLKHEIRSTSRIMLPLFGVVMLLSCGVSLAVRTHAMDSNVVLRTISFLISSAYGIALAAVFIVVLVLMINRFRSNLLGDEGYVMFTLPVSVHQLIWSKIIVSCLWFVGTCVVVGLSGLIVTFDTEVFMQFGSMLRELWQEFNAYYALNGGAILIELLILFFIGYAACCLQFYSAMAVGHSFDRRKILYSVLFFFGAEFVMQFIGSILFLSDPFVQFAENFFQDANLQAMGSIHLAFGLAILGTLIYSAIFYFITTYFLQKRLNIE